MKFVEIAPVNRKIIYTVTVILVVFSAFGMMRLTSTGFIVDDIPHNDKLYTDLKFFEQHFKGVMPFEVMIEGKEKNALKKGNTLKKMDQLQDTLKKYSEFSSPLSVIEAIKFINQASASGDPSQYKLIKIMRMCQRYLKLFYLLMQPLF